MQKGYAIPSCEHPGPCRLGRRRAGAPAAWPPPRAIATIGVPLAEQDQQRRATGPRTLPAAQTASSLSSPAPTLPHLPRPLSIPHPSHHGMVSTGVRPPEDDNSNNDTHNNDTTLRDTISVAPRNPVAAESNPTVAEALTAAGPSSGGRSAATAAVTAAAAKAVHVVGRRAWLLSAACLVTGWAADAGGGGGGGTWGRAAHAAASAAAGPAVDLSTLQEEAYLAYAERRFQDAVNLLTECIAAEPGSPRWREMRAEALVDGKNFPAALEDFEVALGLVSDADLVTRARLLTGRALAQEGLSRWEEALGDYRRGMDLAAEAGESLDPYILNSIGNCLNSLGRWEEAREQYLASAAVFQQARGFRGRNGSTTPRLDGAIFASSNAALMRAQLGDTDGAVQEMVRIARRAPGSADMRAALAALYWGQGRQREAEEMWEFACDRITVGCVKYTDLDWLGRIRRWPPVMVARMADFLAMR